MLYALCSMFYALCSMLYFSSGVPKTLCWGKKPANVGQNVTIQTILSQHCRRKVRLVLSLPKGRSFVFLIAYTVSSSSYKLESSHRAFDIISLNRPTAKITPFSPFVSSHASWLEGRENCGCHLILMKVWSEKQTQSDFISAKTHG